MATVVLSVVGGIVGGVFGGPVGAMVGRGIGALAGAAIDNAVFAPKGQTREGPRLNDRSVSASTYGLAIPIAFGEKIRGGTNMIWSRPIIETVNRRRSGGKGGGGSSTSVEYTYSAEFAVAICEGPIQSVSRIFADGKAIYNSADTPKQNLALNITAYLGTETQPQDSLIAARDGIDNTPAYRGLAYIVFDNLQLANFGNRIPAITVEFEPGQENVAGALNRIAARAGVATMDAASVINPLPGYMIARATSARTAVEELMTAYGLVGISLPGGMSIKPRGVGATGGMDFDMFGTGEDRAAVEDRYRLSRAEEDSLPRSISYTFLEPSRDYQEQTVRASLQEGQSTGAQNYEFALAMASDQAQGRADQILRDVWAGRTMIDGLRLPPSFQAIRPGETIIVLMAGRWRWINLTKMSIGANGLVEVSGAIEEAGTFRPRAAVTDIPAVPPNLIPAVVPTTLHLLDLPMLSSADDNAGFYIMAGGPIGWRAASVLRSIDNVNFDRLIGLGGAGTIGTCTTALPNGPWLFFDEAATLDVQLLDVTDTLESTTNAGLFGTVNGALVGDEIIQFRTATLLGPGNYRLSGFARGRLGTDRHTGTHSPGERFVLLASSVGLDRVADGLALRNAPRFYKGVSQYQPEGLVGSIAFTNTAEALRPYSPVNLAGTRTGNDLAIGWTRRSRIPTGWQDGVDVPLGQSGENYEVEVWNAGNTAVLRTLFVSNATAVTYTEAQQIADFGSAQPAINIRVYQVSPDVGRGAERRGVL